MKRQSGQALPVCVCGKCFGPYAAPYVGEYLDDVRFLPADVGLSARPVPEGQTQASEAPADCGEKHLTA